MHIHLFIVWGRGYCKNKDFSGHFWERQGIPGDKLRFLFLGEREFRGEMPNVFQKPSEMLIFLGTNKPQGIDKEVWEI